MPIGVLVACTAAVTPIAGLGFQRFNGYKGVFVLGAILGAIGSFVSFAAIFWFDGATSFGLITLGCALQVTFPMSCARLFCVLLRTVCCCTVCCCTVYCCTYYCTVVLLYCCTVVLYCVLCCVLRTVDCTVLYSSPAVCTMLCQRCDNGGQGLSYGCIHFYRHVAASELALPDFRKWAIAIVLSGMLHHSQCVT